MLVALVSPLAACPEPVQRASARQPRARRHASGKRTSLQKNRVGVFGRRPPGPRRVCRPQVADLASGCTARRYEPASGPPFWLSRDPIAEKGGANLYGMVGNDVVNQTDILGLSGVATAPTPSAPTVELYPPGYYPPGFPGSSDGPAWTIEHPGVGGVSISATATAFVVSGALLVVPMDQIVGPPLPYDTSNIRVPGPINPQFEDSAKQDALSKEIAQRLERRAYHKICDEPNPPGLTGCDLWRWQLAKEIACVKGRQDYVDKWNDTYPGHQDQIAMKTTRIKDLEERIKRECKPCPPAK